MKLLSENDIYEINNFFNQSTMAHDRNSFVFAQPCQRVGKTPYWTRAVVDESIKWINIYKALPNYYKGKDMPKDLIRWIESNKPKKLKGFDKAMKLMIVR